MIHGFGDLLKGFAVGGYAGKFMLRGFPKGSLVGPKVLLGSLECRFPLTDIERGLGLWPLFLNRVEGGLFLDFGTAGKDIGFEALRLSLGGELRPQLILSYTLPLELRLGVAWGCRESRPQFYLGFGSSF